MSDALIPRNAASVRAPRPGKPEIKPLSPDQARKLLATSRETGDRFEALYVLALHCGLREGELLGLRWDDIDLSGTTANATGKAYTLRDQDRPQLREAQERQRPLHKVLPEGHRSPGEPPDPSERGEALGRPTLAGQQPRLPDPTGTTTSGTNLLGRHFKPLLKSAGLPQIRLHDLRHTCATILLMAGKHPKYIQELLGHASISLTLDTYSHVIEGMDDAL